MQVVWNRCEELTEQMRWRDENLDTRWRHIRRDTSETNKLRKQNTGKQMNTERNGKWKGQNWELS